MLLLLPLVVLLLLVPQAIFGYECQMEGAAVATLGATDASLDSCLLIVAGPCAFSHGGGAAAKQYTKTNCSRSQWVVLGRSGSY